MAKGHSKETRKTKKTISEHGKDTAKKHRVLPEKKQISLQTILTATSVDEKFEEMNIQQVDLEELFEDDKFLKDLYNEEYTDEMSLKDEYGEIEDEDIDFDEPLKPDPFNIEERDEIRKAKYIVEVFVKDDRLDVQFKHVPMFNPNDNLINDTLIRRCRIFKEMAYFIAEKQRDYFINPALNNLNPLEQKELVEHLQNKEYKLKKGHISRMLDALYFRIKGKGDIPAKRLFERSILGLKKKEMLNLAVEFLENYKENGKQLDRAKRFHEYLKSRNIEIPLSNNPNENDKFRYLKNILKEVERNYEKTQN